MDDYDRIEEPPLMPRSKALTPSRRGPGRFATWRRGRATRPRDATPRPPFRPRTRTIIVALAAFVVVGVQAWTMQRLASVRTDLSMATAGLDEARGSLGLLWDTTKRLDEDQIVRLGALADSIRSVFAYAQGEVRLWETAYYEQEQRLDENAANIAANGGAIARMTVAARTVTTRLDQLARADEAQVARVDALELHDRTQASVVQALARRAQSQEASVLGMTTTLTTLRGTLADLDVELADLEDQLAASGSAYGQLDTRIATLAGWIEGFRRAGLSGEAVASQLSQLAAELRRVRVRVDSLRPVRTTVDASEEPR